MFDAGFGPTIAIRRRQMGFSQSELSRRAKISQQHISLIEKGRLEPGVKTLRRLLEALSLTLKIEPIRFSASAVRRRLDSLNRFNAWERTQQENPDIQEAFARAGHLASLEMSLHPKRVVNPQETHAQARDWKAWRAALSKIRP